MKELLDKLSSYNIFNYLFPGVLFVIFARKFTNYNFIQEDIVLGVFVYYFIGLIVSRIGSLIIEPILSWKKISFIKFAPYKDFITASKKDDKIDLLSEINNMYRTICSLFLTLLLLKCYEVIERNVSYIKNNGSFIFVILLALFIFSYRKQADYVRKRVESKIKK